MGTRTTKKPKRAVPSQKSIVEATNASFNLVNQSFALMEQRYVAQAQALDALYRLTGLTLEILQEDVSGFADRLEDLARSKVREALKVRAAFETEIAAAKAEGRAPRSVGAVPSLLRDLVERLDAAAADEVNKAKAADEAQTRDSAEK